MDKGRLEAFSDGVFSIVMTLLIFDIKVPVLSGTVTNGALWQQLDILLPHILIYVVTFTVLSTFWINHHFLFHGFVKKIDRWLNLLNLLFLMFVAFVPFSADFIGSYHHYQPAAIVYGINIFSIVLISTGILWYIKKNPELLAASTTKRILNQGRFRSLLSLSSYLLGILFTFISIPVSIFLYMFPVIFNIIPGTLDLTEKLFKFSLD